MYKSFGNPRILCRKVSSNRSISGHDSKVLGEGLASRRKKQAAEARKGLKTPGDAMSNKEHSNAGFPPSEQLSSAMEASVAQRTNGAGSEFPEAFDSFAESSLWATSSDMHLPYSFDWRGSPVQSADSHFSMASLEPPYAPYSDAYNVPYSAPQAYEAKTSDRSEIISQCVSQRAQSGASHQAMADDYSYDGESIPYRAPYSAPQAYEVKTEPGKTEHTSQSVSQSAPPDASRQAIADDYSYNGESIPVAASLTKLFGENGNGSSSTSEEESRNASRR